MKHREAVLESGLLLLALGLAAAAGLFLAGKAIGGRQEGRRRGRAAPPVGSIEPERHLHFSTVAAR